MSFCGMRRKPSPKKRKFGPPEPGKDKCIRCEAKLRVRDIWREKSPVGKEQFMGWWNSQVDEEEADIMAKRKRKQKSENSVDGEADGGDNGSEAKECKLT